MPADKKRRDSGPAPTGRPLSRTPNGAKPSPIRKGWCYICGNEHLWGEPHIK